MVSWRLTQVAAAGALAAVAGLASACAASPAATASPVARKAAAAQTWRMQAPPAPAGTTDQAFGAVSCSSSSACLAIAINDYPRGFGGFAETWNGSRWTVRTVPDWKTADDLDGVACASTHWCAGVGSKASGDDGSAPVADRWSGRTWTQAEPPVPAGATNTTLAGVACPRTTACTAVGSSAKGTGAPRPLAERWNGSAWKIQPVPAPSADGSALAAVSCPATDACRAVGSDTTGLFSEVWNGSSWRIRPVPVPAGGSFAGLNGISCTAAGSCEAVGSYSKGGSFRSLADAWNGSRWLIQGQPAVSGATSSQLNAVSCVSAADCEAAGDARTRTGAQAGLLEKWNGTRWSVQETVRPAGNTSARLSGISCTPGPVCEAAGYYEKTTRHSHLLALRYSSR